MIREVNYKEIPENIIKQAKKESITFLDQCIYFGYFIDENIIGISAVRKLKKISILKSSFVLPEYRNKGIYKDMVKYRIDQISHKIIETNAKKESCNYLISIGFTEVKKYKIATKLRYEKTNINS